MHIPQSCKAVISTLQIWMHPLWDQASLVGLRLKETLIAKASDLLVWVISTSGLCPEPLLMHRGCIWPGLGCTS